MSRLVFLAEDDAWHTHDDVALIVRACAKAGYVISRADARAAWEAYSEGMAAGWMQLPDWDEDIVDIVRRRCVVEDV